MFAGLHPVEVEDRESSAGARELVSEMSPEERRCWPTFPRMLKPMLQRSLRHCCDVLIMERDLGPSFLTYKIDMGCALRSSSPTTAPAPAQSRPSRRRTINKYVVGRYD